MKWEKRMVKDETILYPTELTLLVIRPFLWKKLLTALVAPIGA